MSGVFCATKLFITALYVYVYGQRVISTCYNDL